MVNCSEIAKAATENNARVGWDNRFDWKDPHDVPARLALIHAEVSEALEAFRINDRANFAEELADVVIRVAHLAHGLDIDLDEEVRAKLIRNAQRPFKHGGKRI